RVPESSALRGWVRAVFAQPMERSPTRGVLARTWISKPGESSGGKRAEPQSAQASAAIRGSEVAQPVRTRKDPARVLIPITHGVAPTNHPAIAWTFVPRHRDWNLCRVGTGPSGWWQGNAWVVTSVWSGVPSPSVTGVN